MPRNLEILAEVIVYREPNLTLDKICCTNMNSRTKSLWCLYGCSYKVKSKHTSDNKLKKPKITVNLFLVRNNLLHHGILKLQHKGFTVQDSNFSITRATRRAVGDHLRKSGHTLDMSSVILGREDNMFRESQGGHRNPLLGLVTLNWDNWFKLPVIYYAVLSCHLWYKSS